MFEWLNENSREILKRGYLLPGVSPEERIRQIADNAERLLRKPGFSNKFYEYMGRGFYSLSTPIWLNYGLGRGLPISCFGSTISDSIASILYTQSEVGIMSKFGGGTAVYLGDIRPRGSQIKNNGVTSGSVHFLQLFSTISDVISQGGARRGHTTPYLPVEHGDIEEFLDIGTEGNPIQNITTAVTVTDKWFKEMISGDKEKRKIWGKVLQRRSEIGFPYIMFTDNVNNSRQKVYKDKDLLIKHSQLCSEILLNTDQDNSFVCCLSSMNLEKYDEWKNTDAVETMIYFLDSVIEEFLEKLEAMKCSGVYQDQQAFEFMKRAYNFAKRERALGLGVLGWHSLLQSKMIPFVSEKSTELTNEIFSLIQERSVSASQKLAEEYGEPELMKGYGRRNSHLIALAPTTSSSFILGQVSQSIEPLMSNYYVKDLEKIKVSVKNKYLKKLLQEKGKDSDEVWESIRTYDGSVQHLDFLSPEEKEVFLTFQEIDQFGLIQQAALRQTYIDQGQSLNLMINPKTPAKEINLLMIKAWELGIKTLYYQHSTNSAQSFSQSKLQCISCES